MEKGRWHVWDPEGAPFHSRDEDFVVSSNRDFHPTDVVEDADGSLLILDTGGWYKLCCPTSQLHKPDVLGAIYRVRKTGARWVENPRGFSIEWAKYSPEELAPLLADERPVVQRRAIAELARRKDSAEPVLARIVGVDQNAKTTKDDEPLEKLAQKSPRMRRNAVWAVTRI